MRALYLFLIRHDGGFRSTATPDEAGLAPIRPGAFARWMAARDAADAAASAELVVEPRRSGPARHVESIGATGRGHVHPTP